MNGISKEIWRLFINSLHSVMDNKVLKNRFENINRYIDKLINRVKKKESELSFNLSRGWCIDKISRQFKKTRKAIDDTEIESKGIIKQKAESKGISEEAFEQSSMGEDADPKLTSDLLKQLHEVEIKLASVSHQNSHVVAQNIVKTHLIAGMALGLLPIPLFDIASLTGTQLSLLRSLSQHYGVDFDEKKGKVILTSLVSGSLPVLTVLSLSSLSKAIPGFGTLGGGISMTVLVGAVVYATGQVFIRHFEAGGTFEDFKSKHWQAYFKKQVEEGRILMNKKNDITGV